MLNKNLKKFVKLNKLNKQKKLKMLIKEWKKFKIK